MKSRVQNALIGAACGAVLGFLILGPGGAVAGAKAGAAAGSGA